MTERPWFKWYPTDWRSEPRLRMCSFAARGLWIDMLGVMHEATPRGHLLIGDIIPNAQQLAALFGGSAAEIVGLLEELESAGVFSRTRTGVIYSRKMTRDEKKRRKAVENGKMGGNPSLCKKTENHTSDKGRLKTQSPESRVKRTEESYDSSATSSDLNVDFERAIWDNGVAFLKRAGIEDRKARGIIGKWRKDHSDADIFRAFVAANRTRAVEPVAFITQTLNGPAVVGGKITDDEIFKRVVARARMADGADHDAVGALLLARPGGSDPGGGAD